MPKEKLRSSFPRNFRRKTKLINLLLKFFFFYAPEDRRKRHVHKSSANIFLAEEKAARPDCSHSVEGTTGEQIQLPDNMCRESKVNTQGPLNRCKFPE